jgi:hypothetical protein
MRTVFRARVKTAGPRHSPWVATGGIMDTHLVGIDLNVAAYTKYPDGSQVYMTVYMTVSEDPALDGWLIHESDLDLFESWVEFPKGAELIASTYTAERLLPEIT